MMAHFANKLHVDKQKVDRMESAVLLSLIGGGLALYWAQRSMISVEHFRLGSCQTATTEGAPASRGESSCQPCVRFAMPFAKAPAASQYSPRSAAPR